MTTFTDGAPPSVTPGPDDGSDRQRAGSPGSDTAPDADLDAGSTWLRDEIQRRIAEGAAGSGGRHARRGEPMSSSSAGYVPRHSVATPGPGAPRPGPVGGQMSQASELLRRERTEGAARPVWSGPPTQPTEGHPGAPPSSTDPPAAGPPGQVADGSVSARPGAAAAAAMRGAARGRARTAATAAAPPAATAPSETTTPSGVPAQPAAGSSPTAPAGPAARAAPARQRPSDAPPDPSTTAPVEAAAPAIPTDVRPAGPAASAPAPTTPPSAGPASGTAPARVVPPEGVPSGIPGTGAEPTPPQAAALSGPAPPAAPAGHAPTPGPAAPPRVPGAPQTQPPTPPPTAVPPPPTGADPAGKQPTEPVRPVTPESTTPTPPAGAPPEAAPDEDAGRPGPVDSPPGEITVPEQRGAELRGARFPRSDAPEDLASKRVRVVLAERKGVARPVRTVVDITEGTGVGELLRKNLIGSQLAVALRFAIGAGLTLGLLPLLFAMMPELGRMEVLGIRLPWLLLGVLVYPFLFGLGFWHTRAAEHVEQSFAEHVQD